MINPLSGALAQSSQLQLQQAADKSKQARKIQQQLRNIGADEDEIEEPEPPVENAEELSAVHDQPPESDKRRKPGHHRPEDDADEESQGDGIDLTA